MYNVMAGFERSKDRLPDRFYNETLKACPPEGKKMPREGFEKALSEYYEYRGWDEKGRPRQAKLRELGIEDKFT